MTFASQTPRAAASVRVARPRARVAVASAAAATTTTTTTRPNSRRAWRLTARASVAGGAPSALLTRAVQRRTSPRGRTLTVRLASSTRSPRVAEEPARREGGFRSIRRATIEALFPTTSARSRPPRVHPFIYPKALTRSTRSIRPRADHPRGVALRRRRPRGARHRSRRASRLRPEGPGGDREVARADAQGVPADDPRASGRVEGV